MDLAVLDDHGSSNGSGNSKLYAMATVSNTTALPLLNTVVKVAVPRYLRLEMIHVQEQSIPSNSSGYISSRQAQRARADKAV